jgi:hypothetical protein
VLLRTGNAVLVLVLSACNFQGGIDPGFQCGEDGWCPAGQSCVGGFCTSDPSAGDAGPDADPNAPDGGPPGARCGTLAIVRDDFGDGVLGGEHFWDWQDTGVTVSETGGHLVIDIPAGTATGWGGYSTKYLYDLTEGTWEAKVTQAGGRFTTLEVRAHDATRAQMIARDGELIALVVNTPDEGIRASIPYVPGEQLYWRLRESGGMLHWEFSSDRASWTELHSEATPIPTEHITAFLSGGEQTEAAGQIRFDDVNLVASDPPAYCPAEQLSDDFLGDSLGVQWGYWEGGACTTTVSGGNLVFDFSNGTGSEWCGIESRHLFDLRDSAVILDAGGAFGANNLITYFQATLPTDDTTHLEIARDDDTVLRVEQLLGGAFQSGTTRSYSESDHRYWRLRGEAGRVYFDTSPDLSTWTTHVEDDAAFDLSEVIIIVAAGHYSGGPGVPVTTRVGAIVD